MHLAHNKYINLRHQKLRSPQMMFSSPISGEPCERMTHTPCQKPVKCVPGWQPTNLTAANTAASPALLCPISGESCERMTHSKARHKPVKWLAAYPTANNSSNSLALPNSGTYRNNARYIQDLHARVSVCVFLTSAACCTAACCTAACCTAACCTAICCTI